MPAAVHHCWDRVFRYAMSEFTNIPGYGERDAVLTADAAIAGWYTTTGRPRARRRRWQLPRLGAELITLGEFRAVWTCDPLGTITRHSFTSPRIKLLWSETRKIAVVFPRLQLVADGRRPSARADALMRLWQRGRGARASFDSPSTPEPLMEGGQVALAVEYVSDKFSDRGESVFYVHHHEPDVFASCSVRSYSNREPIALVLRGGTLRITPDGLEG